MLKPINKLKLSPFRRLCVTIGELPTSFIESMSYYELLAWFCDYLQKTVIPAVNGNALAVKELQEKFVELKEYVDKYFDTLDVQEEINNKLDEMAESGELADIIAQYLELAGVLAFNTTADLKDADNLAEGSTARTLGSESYKDGEGAYYKIRALVNTDVIDGYNLVSLTNYPTLVAERIVALTDKAYDINYLYSETESNFGNSSVLLGEKNIIIDFGNDNHTTNDFLNSKSVKKIDAIIITHYHGDHTGTGTIDGLSAVLNNTNIDFSDCVAYLPHKGVDYSKWQNPADYQAIENLVKDALTNAGIVWHEPNNEEVVLLDSVTGLSLEFYNIGEEFYEYYYDILWEGATSPNNFSMMTLVKMRGKTAFFGGDMEYMSTKLNAKYLNNVDIYHVLHHGIAVNTDAMWNANLSPKFCVVTRRTGSGDGKRYGASDLTACVSKGAILIDTKSSQKNGCISVYDDNIISKINSDTTFTANITSSPSNALLTPIDLNDLKTQGTYYIPDGTLVAQFQNMPPAMLNIGSGYTGTRIDVISTTSTTAYGGFEGVRQIVTFQNLSNEEDKIFYRSYGPAGSNRWNKWKMIKTAYPYDNDVWLRVVCGTCWVTTGAKDLVMWVPFTQYEYKEGATEITLNNFSSLNVRIPSGGYLLNNVTSTDTTYTYTYGRGSNEGFYITVRKADGSTFDIPNNTNCAFELWNLNFHIDALI